MKKLSSLILIWISLISSQAQELTNLPIALPIQGSLVFEAESQLVLLNTFSGGFRILDQIDSLEIYSPQWNLYGNRIAYNRGIDIGIVNPFQFPQSIEIIPDNLQFAGFRVQSWNADDNHLLGTGIDINSTYYDIQILNISDQSRITIRRDFIDLSLIEHPQLEFHQIRYIAWNPVYEDWIAIHLSTSIEGTETDPERPSVQVILVFNYVTKEFHILNDVISNEVFRMYENAWSPDGRQLLLETEDKGTQTEIVTVLNTDGDWHLQLEKIAHDRPVSNRGSQRAISWFGIGDLLLFMEQDTTTIEQVYFVAQIIQGQLHLIEFFRIPITNFSTALTPNIGKGDWHLTADQAERHTLSCLFDQAQPTRLSIGERARVNFTTGTPLRLRAEPDLNLDPIQQMPEGTEFDVIGGPACVNAATDYYRFWQIQLSDGTVGWAAEAGMTDYFMEPLPDIVNCSTTIANTPALLSAITSANATPEPDTICLETGTYMLTSSNNSAFDGPNGLPVITSDITLHGLGAGATILRDSTAPAFRILKVDTGARLVLENITVSGGDAGSGSGGGIRNLGTLELRNSVIENNLPDDLSGEGTVKTR